MQLIGVAGVRDVQLVHDVPSWQEEEPSKRIKYYPDRWTPREDEWNRDGGTMTICNVRSLLIELRQGENFGKQSKTTGKDL